MKAPVRRGINGGKSAEKPRGTQEGFIRSEPVRRQRRLGGRVPAGRLVRARIGKRNAESGKGGAIWWMPAARGKHGNMGLSEAKRPLNLTNSLQLLPNRLTDIVQHGHSPVASQNGTLELA